MTDSDSQPVDPVELAAELDQFDISRNHKYAAGGAALGYALAGDDRDRTKKAAYGAIAGYALSRWAL